MKFQRSCREKVGRKPQEKGQVSGDEGYRDQVAKDYVDPLASLLVWCRLHKSTRHATAWNVVEANARQSDGMLTRIAGDLTHSCDLHFQSSKGHLRAHCS